MICSARKCHCDSYINSRLCDNISRERAVSSRLSAGGRYSVKCAEISTPRGSKLRSFGSLLTFGLCFVGACLRFILSDVRGLSALADHRILTASAGARGKWC